MLFARSDGARGANIGASAAVNTYAGVDRVLFAFRNCARGAFVNASAASNAIVANYVSHNRRVKLLIELLVEGLSLLSVQTVSARWLGAEGTACKGSAFFFECRKTLARKLQNFLLGLCRMGPLVGVCQEAEACWP